MGQTERRASLASGPGAPRRDGSVQQRAAGTRGPTSTSTSRVGDSRTSAGRTSASRVGGQAEAEPTQARLTRSEPTARAHREAAAAPATAGQRAEGRGQADMEVSLSRGRAKWTPCLDVLLAWRVVSILCCSSDSPLVPGSAREVKGGCSLDLSEHLGRLAAAENRTKWVGPAGSGGVRVRATRGQTDIRGLVTAGRAVRLERSAGLKVELDLGFVSSCS